MTALAPEPVVADAGSGDDLMHAACACTPDIALCGTDVSNLPWGDDFDETTCVVCRELEDLACPKCSR